MREIKFRAWDKKLKRIRKVVRIDFSDLTADLFHSTSANSRSYVHLRRFTDIELMQCTFLRDKNGVEIYEGDIIKKTGDIKTYSIVFDGVLAAYLMDDGTGGYGLNQMLLRDFEIIGNIYENSELLNKA
ncbi:YopX family protein [Campylobacter sp. RM16187]|uniref:YopX family protein n=1 Tax=Campylobacter sp. RM16187 TaxID=1660063 RepID=UPI0021B6E27F|nr:YopX family protein [Campylobacter sp. RM16187]QKG28777.1 YopX family protein [Campylobacter sp. RM16187]